VPVNRLSPWTALLGALALTATAGAQAPSDSCASAPLIGAGVYNGTTAGATTDGSSACAGSADAWYRFEAPADGMLLVDSCGSGFNTVLSLHSGCPGDTSNQTACSDNETLFGPCAGGAATTSFLCASVTGGESYVLRIAGAAGATGAFQVRLIFGAGRGITVLTHGFQLSDGPGTATPNWLFTMAHAIQKRVPCSKVAVYEADDQVFLEGSFTTGGAWQPTTNPLTLDPAQETILIFDWAVESGGLFKNDFTYEGWSEGAADAMIAALVRLTGGVESLGDYAWHFVGHSRGAVVNSEAVERLAGFGVGVDHLTALDPHDFDQSGVPFDEDWRDWTLGLPQGPGNAWQSSWGFTTWENVAHSDNFYSTESTFLTPDGRPSGSLARELDVGALSPATIDHSRVHAWYHGTADLIATSDGDGFTIQANWYPGSTRMTDGWNHARLGGVARPGPTNGLLKYAPLWHPLVNGVFNGDFRLRSPNKPDPIAGWYLHGGDQVEDTIRVEVGGNLYIELNTTNALATHNLLTVPPEATHLRLRAFDAAPEFFIADETVGAWREPRLVARGTAWSWFDYEIPPAHRGHAAIIALMLPAGSALIGVDDLHFVVNEPACACPGNGNGDSAVDFDDLVATLAEWLTDYAPGTGPGDANCDGIVDFDDITAVLGNWGAVCP